MARWFVALFLASTFAATAAAQDDTIKLKITVDKPGSAKGRSENRRGGC
jgi:hypothetical protein